MAGTRRPSMWQTSSSGSIGSNNSGGNLGSPNNSIVGQPLYQSPPPIPNFADPHATSNYVATAPFNPPSYQQQQPDAYQRRGSSVQQDYSGRPSNSRQTMPQPFAYNSNATSMPQSSFPQTNPHSQFGAWGGYSGPSVPDTLDEENAVPPNSGP